MNGESQHKFGENQTDTSTPKPSDTSGKPKYKRQRLSGPKPIKATEIRAFLYAWCGQRKLRPDYDITSNGSQPRLTFTCKLSVADSGVDYVAEVVAGNKKESQSRAAWDFCENLVKLGIVNSNELPAKPTGPVSVRVATGPGAEATPQSPAETKEEIAKHGGWVLTNSRQRLNQFCHRQRVTPDFKYETVGPVHSRVYICSLKITIESVDKDFEASAEAVNKKQSTGLCAMLMVRQLYEASVIEKFGDQIKHYYPTLAMDSVQAPVKYTGSSKIPDDHWSRKRKAEDETDVTIDENGNWTVEVSRQRLNQYCQVQNAQCDLTYTEEGQPGSRTYTASAIMKVMKDEEEKELTATYEAQSKKAAAQGCALQLLSQLYKMELVEANIPSLGPSTKRKSSGRMKGLIGDLMSGIGSEHLMWSGRLPFRRTIVQDNYLSEKHKQIYPTEKQLDIVQKAVRVIELALKEVADELVEPCDDATAKKEPAVKVEPEVKMDVEEDKKDADENVEMTEAAPLKRRKLQSVVRVGTLAKGLLLKGDLSVQLVLLCQEAPTRQLLVQVAKLLPTYFKIQNETDKISLKLEMNNAAIVVSYTSVSEEVTSVVKVTISVTSPIIRSPPKEEAASESKGKQQHPLNKEKCMQALAEVRHAKWFQACTNGIPYCIIVIRVLRDMTTRLPEWKPLSDWSIELLVEKALRSALVPYSLGGSFQRVLECISSGILLPGQSSLMDPCERETLDTAANLTNQQRESITASAQDMLRKFTFRKTYQVLGVEEFKRKEYPPKESSTEAEPKAEDEKTTEST